MYVREYMKSPVITVTPDTLLDEARTIVCVDEPALGAISGLAKHVIVDALASRAARELLRRIDLRHGSLTPVGHGVSIYNP